MRILAVAGVVVGFSSTMVMRTIVFALKTLYLMMWWVSAAAAPAAGTILTDYDHYNPIITTARIFLFFFIISPIPCSFHLPSLGFVRWCRWRFCSWSWINTSFQLDSEEAHPALAVVALSRATLIMLGALGASWDAIEHGKSLREGYRKQFVCQETWRSLSLLTWTWQIIARQENKKRQFILKFDERGMKKRWMTSLSSPSSLFISFPHTWFGHSRIHS